MWHWFPTNLSDSRKLLAAIRSLLALRVVVVLALIFALVAIGGRLVTGWTIERLVHEIGTSDDSTAGQLVQQLAAFGPRAYPSLVAAASSRRSAVALAARDEIDHLVDRWQQAAYLHPVTFDLEGQALPLAQQLEIQLASLTPSGKLWARGTLIALLELARKQEFQHRWELLRVCDRAISSLPAIEPLAGFEPDVDYRLTLAPPPQLPPREAAALVNEPRSVELVPIPGQAKPLNASSVPPSPQAPLEQPTEELRVPEPIVLGEIPAPIPARSHNNLDEWDPRWNVDHLPVNSPTDTSSDDDRTLFALLASGTEPEQQAATQALLLRGYGTVAPREARMMVSPSAADRRALVNLAMTSPSLEAEKWLWRLAHDPAGEVRAAAVAGIRTSGNHDLVEAALELAIRDTDPRVAEQSSALKKRLR